MQATEQKPSALPKKKTGWGEGKIDKNEVTIWWLQIEEKTSEVILMRSFLASKEYNKRKGI